MLKYLVMIFIVAAFIIYVLRFAQCNADNTASVFVPADSGFAHIIKKTYKPASTPLEHPSKPDVKLPRNISESEVSRIIIMHLKEQPLNDTTTYRLIRSLTLIETKDGSIYIDTSQVKSVEMIAYEEPILRFGFFISLGVSMSLQHITLSGAISPLQICGVIQFPLLALDTEGIGGGIGVRTHEILFGVLFHQPLTGDRQLKISFTYNL